MTKSLRPHSGVILPLTPTFLGCVRATRLHRRISTGKKHSSPRNQQRRLALMVPPVRHIFPLAPYLGLPPVSVKWRKDRQHNTISNRTSSWAQEPTPRHLAELGSHVPQIYSSTSLTQMRVCVSLSLCVCV
ncbi:hypothetical protein BX666DRAFT_348232 [Dichotomocladium elegans]|nr:hypothetical protein BX666DRAFT_348232 [Dichotomocladium elegans]